MHKRKKMRAGSYLLFRWEGEYRVWLYEYLQWHELKARMKEGWRVWT